VQYVNLNVNGRRRSSLERGMKGGKLGWSRGEGEGVEKKKKRKKEVRVVDGKEELQKGKKTQTEQTNTIITNLSQRMR
jgi:hypothetical protein